MVTIVKITKRPRSSEIIHYLFLPYEPTSGDEGITELVEDWCREDPSGSCYGYSYHWERVTDQETINARSDIELGRIESKINALKKFMQKIEENIIK
jgi:hypothetical protein